MSLVLVGEDIDEDLVGEQQAAVGQAQAALDAALAQAGAIDPRESALAVDIGGVRVPAGAKLLVLVASANRDPQVFPDPDRLDITREQFTGFFYFNYGPWFRMVGWQPEPLALMLWGLLWGGIGLLLAIPITAGLKAVCDHVEGLEPYGKLLGD